VVIVMVGTAWFMPQQVQGQPSLLTAVLQAFVPSAEPEPLPALAEELKTRETTNESLVIPVLESPSEVPAQVHNNSKPSVVSVPDATIQHEVPATAPANLLDDGISRSQGSPPGTNRLVTRIYKVDRGLMQVKLESGAGQVTAGTFVTNLLQHLKMAGVDFSPGRTNGCALYFSDSAGALFVRATLEDLDTIEKAIQFLNTQPPQIMIEARFVEISSDTDIALDFSALAGLKQMDFHYAAGATNQETKAIDADTIIGSRELRGDELDWVGRSATNAHNLRVNSLLGAVRTGHLKDSQMRTVIRALEQRNGVDIMTAPRVTTLSGRQAQIQVCELKTVVTGINPDATVKPGQPPVKEVTPLVTTAIPTGPVLDVVPQVGEDGFTIHLTALPSLVEFMGYDEPPHGKMINVWEDGRKKSIAPPLPRFRVRSMQAQAVLQSGQTIVMESFPVTETSRVKGKSKTITKRLLVFVTATIVDSEGNPQINSASSRSE
jgi:type II secretory pathway component GspD/PulD (secretin)